MTVRSVKLTTLKKMSLTDLFYRTTDIEGERRKIGQRYLQMEPGTKGYTKLMKRDRFLITELHKTRKAQVHIRNRRKK